MVSPKVFARTYAAGRQRTKPPTPQPLTVRLAWVQRSSRDRMAAVQRGGGHRASPEAETEYFADSRGLGGAFEVGDRTEDVIQGLPSLPSPGGCSFN